MRKLLATFVLTACLSHEGSAAEKYPIRPVQLVVGFPAGLTPDIVARLIAQPLSGRLGQRVIVDNRPGAGSNIGTDAVVHAPADGYTLAVLTFANAVNATLYSHLNFDLQRDIAPVVGTFRTPTLLVVAPSFPAKSVAEFIAYDKANPGKVNYASAGYGTIGNVAAELFNGMAGTSLVHVPYRGSFLPDVLGGQVQATFAPIAAVIEYVKGGQLRALAVTSTERLDMLPDVPVLGEFLPGYEASVWHGIGAPEKTPKEVVDRLNTDINAAITDPAMKARFAELGGSAVGGSSADFGEFVRAEVIRWGEVIRRAHIKSE